MKKDILDRLVGGEVKLTFSRNEKCHGVTIIGDLHQLNSTEYQVIQEYFNCILTSKFDITAINKITLTNQEPQIQLLKPVS